MNAADTAWVLVSAALVLFMTPGLARVFAAIFQRLAAEQRAEQQHHDETAA